MKPSPPSASSRLAPNGFSFRALLTLLVAFGPLSTDLYLPSLPSMLFAVGAAEGAIDASVFLLASPAAR